MAFAGSTQPRVQWRCLYDGNWPEAGCEQRDERLRSVAYLPDSNDQHRDNECLHGLATWTRRK